MEDRKVRTDAVGQALRGPDGRYLVTDEVVAILVQEKRSGWGAAYPANQRNGEWEYASFMPDGTPRANVNYGPCFTCHLNRTARDYNFTFNKWVLDGKP
jgi:hemoglobin